MLVNPYLDTSTAAKQQVEDYQKNNQAKSAAAVIASSRSHVIPATTKHQKQHNKQNKQHGLSSQFDAWKQHELTNACECNRAREDACVYQQRSFELRCSRIQTATLANCQPKHMFIRFRSVCTYNCNFTYPAGGF